jgi:FkbM family methyltransferase
MNLKRFLGKCLSAYNIISSKAQPSYSQAGEDQIVRFLFENLEINRPSYLDIGTNHPKLGNNTYYFYLRGCKGVCVEPDPAFYPIIKKYRGRDILLHVGIGVGSVSEASLYVFPYPYSGWNTFSEEEALSRQREAGIAIKQILKVSLETINSVMEKYFKGAPNFLSIDVEGMDLAILQSLDFNQFRPEVICVETIAFNVRNKGIKLEGITTLLQQEGYFIFADTHINTIFCRKDVF